MSITDDMHAPSERLKVLHDSPAANQVAGALDTLVVLLDGGVPVPEELITEHLALANDIFEIRRNMQIGRNL